MDVYLIQHGGAALWVIAVACSLLAILVWALLVQVLAIRRVVAPQQVRPAAANFPGPETAKGPAQPG